jgi:hypothetical protein
MNRQCGYIAFGGVRRKQHPGLPGKLRNQSFDTALHDVIPVAGNRNREGPADRQLTGANLQGW